MCLLSRQFAEAGICYNWSLLVRRALGATLHLATITFLNHCNFLQLSLLVCICRVTLLLQLAAHVHCVLGARPGLDRRVSGESSVRTVCVLHVCGELFARQLVVHLMEARVGDAARRHVGV